MRLSRILSKYVLLTAGPEREGHSHSPAASPGSAEAFHHLSRLHVLLQEPVDVLNARSRPLRDALLTAPVEDRGIASLAGGHRADHGLDAADRLRVDLRALERGTSARQHAEEVLEGTHLAQLRELVAEVLERELVAADLLLELLGLVRVERLFGLLDERHHVAHSEDPGDHPLGMEGLERIGLLARPDELQRQSRHFGDRKS